MDQSKSETKEQKAAGKERKERRAIKASAKRICRLAFCFGVILLLMRQRLLLGEFPRGREQRERGGRGGGEVRERVYSCETPEPGVGRCAMVMGCAKCHLAVWAAALVKGDPLPLLPSLPGSRDPKNEPRGKSGTHLVCRGGVVRKPGGIGGEVCGQINCPGL